MSLFASQEKEKKIIDKWSTVDVQKKAIREIKHNTTGIIGSFIMDKKGKVIEYDAPGSVKEKISKISEILYKFINAIRDARHVNKVIVDFENAKVIASVIDARILVLISEKEINLSLLRITSDIAITRIKKSPMTTNYYKFLP
jgi:predicted regulator of Ras-like GTPase activity (Roadblock/LC7/MglB family)